MLCNYIQLLSHWSSGNPSWQWRIIRNLIVFNFQQRLLDVHNCPKSKLLPVGSRNFHTLSSRLIRRRNLTRGVPNSALDFQATLLQQEMPRNAKRMPNHLTLRKQFLTECKNECMNKQLSVINKWVIDSEWAVVPWANYSSWTMRCCCCCCSIAVVRLLESISPCPLVKPCFSPYAYVCTYMYIHVHTLYTYMCCLRPFLLLTPHIIVWYHINNIKHTSKICSYIIITSIHIYIYMHIINGYVCIVFGLMLHKNYIHILYIIMVL